MTPILEAALRSFTMGIVIFAVLSALRIRQVRAQRTAWLLALVASLLMPALLRWPAARSVSASAPIGRPVDAHAASRPAKAIALSHGILADRPMPRRTAAGYVNDRGPLPAIAGRSVVPSPLSVFRQKLVKSIRGLLAHALPVYLLIVAVLLARLAIGLALAMQLRHSAVKGRYLKAPYQDIRVSCQIQTPVTIASSILLPEASRSWDEARLRVVLAHEAAHVRNGDFYVHLLAGLHCALFWFSPFSWWLQHRLAALGEALGDRAALEQAESRHAYAALLLEFATSARQPIAAIAMARSSNLRPRMDRLLNDRLFGEAFAGKRRLPFVAAAIVPIALLGSIAFVHVHAAEANRPAVGLVPVAAPVAPRPAPDAAHTPQANPAPPSPAVPAPAAEPVPVPPAPEPGEAAVEPISPEALQEVTNAAKDAANETLAAKKALDEALQEDSVQNSDSSMHDPWADDSYALVTGDGSMFNGRYDDSFKELRRKTPGEFFYYAHGGKRYVIQDSAILAQAKALYAPLEVLGKRQMELGRRQHALGAQQEALGAQQETVKVPIPNLTQELAGLDEAMQKLKKLDTSKDLDQVNLAELQEKIGDIEGRLGELQGEAGLKIAAEQGKLGAEQGKLGMEQGRLGAMQDKLAREAHRKLKPLLDQAIRDGRAKPVE